MKKKWTAFLKKIKGADDNFANTLETINVFLREIVSTIFEKRTFTKTWSSIEGKWR